MPNHSVRCWSVLGVVQLHRTSQFIEHFLPFFDHSAELGGCWDLQSQDGSISRCPWPTANAQRISGPGPAISASMMDFKIPNAFLTRLPSFEERIGSFSGGPLTETLLPMQGAWVRSLVGEQDATTKTQCRQIH